MQEASVSGIEIMALSRDRLSHFILLKIDTVIKRI